MAEYIFDIETNGIDFTKYDYIAQVNTIHCIAVKEVGGAFITTDTQKAVSFINSLSKDNLLAGHNIVGFDIPAIKNIFKDFNPKCAIFDTLLGARLQWPQVPIIEGAGRHSHSLKSWGLRLGVWKGDFSNEDTDWSICTPEMIEYCKQDVNVTEALYRHIVKSVFSPEAYNLEHRFAELINIQEYNGFAFDRDSAERLLSTLLVEKTALDQELKTLFRPWYVGRGEFVPKKNSKIYTAGQPLTKIEIVEFNPGSRQHIIEKLKEKYSWNPEKYTDKGSAKMDESVLSKLDYPEARKLARAFMLGKRIGQLSDGNQAWLNLVQEDGRIHGKVNTNGTVTGRCTHNSPNITQVPSNDADYGEECRSLFIAGQGQTLVGVDADALELRCLAGYMSNYDNGALVKTILDGNKDDQTDIHSINSRVLGCSRSTAKTFIYALIYGAGDSKLGKTLNPEAKDSQHDKIGKTARANMMKAFPAFASLLHQVKDRCIAFGYIRGLDGRRIIVDLPHKGLNYLLQSAGSIIMKRALIIAANKIQERGHNVKFVANIHDEFQLECDEKISRQIGELCVESIIESGNYYKFNCPMNGNYKIGNNWSLTH